MKHWNVEKAVGAVQGAPESGRLPHPLSRAAKGLVCNGTGYGGSDRHGFDRKKRDEVIIHPNEASAREIKPLPYGANDFLRWPLSPEVIAL